MTAANTPQSGDSAVPSALSERRRIWQSDTFGTAVYITAALAFAILVVAIVLIAR